MSSVSKHFWYELYHIMSMAKVHPKKSIKVEEFTDWDFTTLPQNTKLYKVCMPEATNIKFYRNHKDSNKIRITFISINEEMKRRHKTIGLYERAIKIYRPIIFDLKWTISRFRPLVQSSWPSRFRSFKSKGQLLDSGPLTLADRLLSVLWTILLNQFWPPL